MLREGNRKFEACNPGIPGIPGNHIKSKVKFNISFIFTPWPAIRQTANKDSISRLNSRPKLPFPGNGKGNYKMPQEGKGGEIWGLYSRESRETGIPAHPCYSHLRRSSTLIQKYPYSKIFDEIRSDGPGHQKNDPDLQRSRTSKKERWNGRFCVGAKITKRAKNPFFAPKKSQKLVRD